ncbi:MAG: TIR domain-containing protein, partial [Planctomycetes bacterium]|nr:TIR domain-containing protein [Planctomycetota bacterium]
MSAKRFRVAFSYAGEKRDFVAKVAAVLAPHLGAAAILYDKYHKAEFSRADLALHLSKLYHDEADLVVAVLCPDYVTKEWCGLEWSAIFSLIKERRAGAVMLTRFERANGDGLHANAGYIDLDDETPESAAALILERLKLNDGPRTDHPRIAPPPRTTIPHNLPRIGSFFGRDKELKIIADALAPRTRTWGVLIDGPGGIGKTALAVRAAELVPAGQFDRIFFLSSKERKMTGDGERKLSDFLVPGYLDMLTELARLLKKPELSKLAGPERAKEVIDALAPARALLILDNLESLPRDQQDQVFEFVGQLPPGCKAIVTSRRRTDVDARIIRLAQLEKPAALELLAELAQDRPLLAKASDAERVQLYEQTGGNPLHIRWVAGQLGKGKHRTIAAALDFLRNAPPDNDPLEFTFGDLLDTFSENETKVLAALAHFTQMMAVKFIAELAGVRPIAPQTALGDLAGRSLVIPDEQEEHFVLAPLVAAFLRKKRPEAVQETGNRLADRASDLIVANSGHEYDRFSILDAAWPTVAPAMPIFANLPDDTFQKLCDGLREFLDFTGRWDDWLSLSELGEAKAVAAGDHNGSCRRAIDASTAFQRRGKWDDSLRCLDRAKAHQKSANAAPREGFLTDCAAACVLDDIARHMYERGDFEKADNR